MICSPVSYEKQIVQLKMVVHYEPLIIFWWSLCDWSLLMKNWQKHLRQLAGTHIYGVTSGDDYGGWLMKIPCTGSYISRHTTYMSNPASRRISPYIQILPLRRSMKMTWSWWRRSLWGYPGFILFLPSLFFTGNKSILLMICFLYTIKSGQNSSLIIAHICKIYMEISQCFLYLRCTGVQ